MEPGGGIKFEFYLLVFFFLFTPANQPAQAWF